MFLQMAAGIPGYNALGTSLVQQKCYHSHRVVLEVDTLHH